MSITGITFSASEFPTVGEVTFVWGRDEQAFVGNVEDPPMAGFVWCSDGAYGGLVQGYNYYSNVRWYEVVHEEEVDPHEDAMDTFREVMSILERMAANYEEAMEAEGKLSEEQRQAEADAMAEGTQNER